MSSVALGVVKQWLRPYQTEWLRDFSRYRVYNKSRRIGISDATALEMVLVSSGMYEGLVWPNNCNLLSWRAKEAKDVLRYARRWVRMLAQDPALASVMELASDSATRLEFARSGFYIDATTQSENSGHGLTGHLYMDEMARYRFMRSIWAGAVPSINSDSRLRLTCISTPNGTSGIGEQFYLLNTDPSYDYFSRHRTTLEQAIVQGMPVDIDEVRQQCKTEEDWLSGYCTKFIGAAGEYYTRAFLDSLDGKRPPGEQAIWMGVDVASEVDLTACVVLRLVNSVLWLCEVYVMSQMPYHSKPGEIGQDIVVASLLHKHRPQSVMLDATGDGAELYAALAHQNLPSFTTLVPHTMSMDWKNDVVPELRATMQRGRVRIDQNAHQYAIDHIGLEASGAGSLKTELTPQIADVIIEAAFYNRDFGDQLKGDFQRVRKKITGSGQTTFDTSRDEDGHGDSFWASAMAYDLARHATPMSAHATTVADVWGDDEDQQPLELDYADYL